MSIVLQSERTKVTTEFKGIKIDKGSNISSIIGIPQYEESCHTLGLGMVTPHLEGASKALAVR